MQGSESVVLYSREACPMCDEARQVLIDAGVECRVVDVDLDPRIKQEYGMSVPVVVFDGAVLFTGGQSPASLRMALSEMGLGSL